MQTAQRRFVDSFLFCLFLSWGVTSYAYSSSGLELMAAGDLVYNQGLNQDSLADEKFEVRSVELGLSSPIDHQFDGFVSFAAHEEDGESVLEVHEAYVVAASLIPRTELKFGQYFLGIGRLNRFHQHDWAFTRAPKTHRDFFDDEAVFDTGLEAKTLISSEHYLELTAGVTSGYKYGHLHSEGNKPKAPTHYLRLSRFFEDSKSAASGSELGLSYLGRTSFQNEQMHLAGIDFVHKKRQGRTLAWIWQSELWYRSLKPDSGRKQEELGGYLMVDKGFSSQWSTGARLDGHKDFSQRNLAGKELNHIHYGLTLQQTYRSSEFFLTRLSASHEFERIEGKTRDKDTRVSLQFVFIVGAHPAHNF